ncbi:MAG: response regulator, partial [Candidatus Electrothrix sp. AR3]|nr:response regulator [Candidatus Electrothrix sp. AR3]
KANLFVETVNNGAEAVAAVAKTDFDAVLMDVQMPIMDGYEATRKIRQDLKKKDLPILAMTAHAVSEERDKCFRMGMDDHIAKPVNRRNLFMTLSRWIENRGDFLVLENHAKCDKSTPSTSIGSILNEFGTEEYPVGLDLTDGLQRLEGNEQLYLKLLKSFCREQNDILVKVENIILKKDFKAAKYIVHSLKGVAGNIGMSTIQKLAGQVETDLLSERPDNAQEPLLRLAQQVTAVVKYLDQRLEPDETTEVDEGVAVIPEDFNRKEALLILQQLASFLEQSDFSSLQFLEGHQNVIRPLLGSQSFAQLMTSIEGFSFDEALTLINKRLKAGAEVGWDGA